MALSALDIALLVAFLAYAAAAGLGSRKVSSQSLEEYFLAGRTLSGWKAGISMAATQFAADTPLLVTGMVAAAGLFSLWRLWIYAIAFFFLAFALAACWRRAGVLTDAELAELRYGGRDATVLRTLKALYFGVAFNCMVLAMVLVAATRIAEPFLRWDLWLPPLLFDPVVAMVSALDLHLSADPAATVATSASNVLSLGFVLATTALYSTTGGLRAVVRTDLVQFAAAMLGTAIYAVLVVRHAGGLAAIPAGLKQAYGDAAAQGLLGLDPSTAATAGWFVIGTIAIQWIAQMNADGTGYLAQRTMACRSDGDARRAAIVFVVAQILLRSLLWLPIAVGLLLVFPTPITPPDPALAGLREQTFVDGIATLMPSGLRGLLLVSMLAALASTVDTHLNWGASYLASDLYERLWRRAWKGRPADPKSLVWVARGANLLLLAIACALAVRISSIHEAWTASLLLGGGMGIPLVMRWLWWRMTARAEIAAIVVCSLAAPVLMATVESEGLRLALVAAFGAAAATALALAGPRQPSEDCVAFYRRVHPPGWWAPVAARCGEDPRAPRRALLRSLAAVAAASAATFAALVGSATLLVGAPPPRGVASAPLYAASLFAFAAMCALAARHASRPARACTEPDRRVQSRP